MISAWIAQSIKHSSLHGNRLSPSLYFRGASFQRVLACYLVRLPKNVIHWLWLNADDSVWRDERLRCLCAVGVIPRHDHLACLLKFEIESVKHSHLYGLRVRPDFVKPPLIA